MLRAYKYELRPTPEQRVQLSKAVGSCRFVYNLALETKIAAYQKGKTLTCFDLMKQLPDLKKEAVWLSEVPSQSLQQAISNLDRSFSNFFKGNAKFPKYKKKQKGGSFRIPIAVQVDYENWTIKLPKYGLVSFNRDKVGKGEIRQATVIKTPTGRYFISVLFDSGGSVPNKKPITGNTSVGIDLGLKHFATLSDGTKIKNPKTLMLSLSKLRIEQRSLSRKVKGSKRKERQRIVVARLHEKVLNRRKDFLHKVSTEITNRYDTICLETLNIRGMIKNRKLSKYIADASWGTFVIFIKYKSEWKGKNVVQIGAFEPSSKMCSCGKINQSLKLSQREWTCEKCNTTHDRDILAAQNIKNFGLRSQPDKR